LFWISTRSSQKRVRADTVATATAYTGQKFLSKESLIKIAVVVAVIAIGLNSRAILTAITGCEVPVAVVEGYSMYPLLREGDVVFAYKAPPEQIKPGQIIIFEGIGGKLIIHRVIDVKRVGDRFYYVTKGDNNQIPDIMHFSSGIGIPYERVKGIVVSVDNAVVKIPYLGYLSIWFRTLFKHG